MRIAIVNHDDFSIWNFRRALIARLVADGHEVDVLCGNGPYISRILDLGVTWVPMEMPRFITPVEDSGACSAPDATTWSTCSRTR